MQNDRADDWTRGMTLNWVGIRNSALDLAESKGLEYNNPALPKTQVRRLASELGVDRLELHEMEDDALVVERTRGQYTMFLNRGHVKSRHRFSVAHEVAHLLISPIVGHRAVHRRRYTDQDDEGRRIEFLCNDMASVILMPRKRVEVLLAQTGPTARCLPSLVKDFGVSFEAAARRYVNVVPQSCALVKWTERNGKREGSPINNFGLRGGWLKLQRTDTLPSDRRHDSSMSVSKQNVVIHPGRYSQLAPVHVREATVETFAHGRGQYQQMFSFVYISRQVAKRLRADRKGRRWSQ